MNPQPHNPAGLTPTEVGVNEGWRLLDVDEVKPRTNSKGVEGWHRRWYEFGLESRFWNITYRTRLSRAALAKLP